jgi:glutamate--cysteine ligase
MALEPVCEALDAGEPDAPYGAALAEQRRALEDPSLTPSARMLAEMRERGEPFFRFAMRRSQEHAEWFRARPLDPERERLFEEEAQRSLSLQAGIEAADTMSFEEYLHRYLSQGLDDRERALA